MARRRIGMADVKEILVQWEAGEAVSVIARRLGYSRPTVRKYIRSAQGVGLVADSRQLSEAEWERLTGQTLAAITPSPPAGAVRAEVARFHEYLAERVGTVRLSVLHQRLRDEEGLGASWGTFYRYVRVHWPERLARAPRVTVRLDDPPPGSEAQVDFFYVGRWPDPEAERTRKLYAFLMTLSHSRHQFLYPVLAEDLTAWLTGHIEAFTFFGGVPRRVVPDNLTAGILRADRYDPRLNRAYGELARYYGCLIDPSRAATPTDKPRVERGVSYARESFFRGREFASLAAMRMGARRWATEVAGNRVHGTTAEAPMAAFLAREQAALLPVPPQPWEPVQWTRGRVHADCHLVAVGVRYSVPYSYVGQDLEVRLGRTTVAIYQGTTLITTHARQDHGRVTRLDHYPKAGQAFLRATPQACLAQATALGPAVQRLVAALLESEIHSQLRQVQAILRLTSQYEAAQLNHACALALEAGDGRYRTVRGLLERAVECLEPESAPSSGAGAYLRGAQAFATAAVPDAGVSREPEAE